MLNDFLSSVVDSDVSASTPAPQSMDILSASAVMDAKNRALEDFSLFESLGLDYAETVFSPAPNDRGFDVPGIELNAPMPPNDPGMFDMALDGVAEPSPDAFIPSGNDPVADFTALGLEGMVDEGDLDLGGDLEATLRNLVRSL